jgi:hypothetical protein
MLTFCVLFYTKKRFSEVPEKFTKSDFFLREDEQFR